MHAESRFARNCSSRLQPKSEVGQVDRPQVSEASSLRHQPKVSVPLNFITGFFLKEQPSPNPLPYPPFDFNLLPFVFNLRGSNFKLRKLSYSLTIVLVIGKSNGHFAVLVFGSCRRKGGIYTMGLDQTA